MKILVVDDDFHSRTVLGALLEMEGHPVDVCDTSVGALAQLQSRPYDFLLTDYVMPEMTGVELSRAAFALQPDIRCCIISGHPRPSDAEPRAMWLSKPIDVDQLLGTLSQA